MKYDLVTEHGISSPLFIKTITLSSPSIFSITPKHPTATLVTVFFFIELFSIDVDNPIWHDHKEYEVGWLVPDELRKNWILKIGDSKTELKPLLESLESVDIFFHDSDHSYSHMLFEFETIFSFLNSDKIILSDDINLNSSIDDFSKQKNLKLEKFFGFGVIRSHND